MATIKIKFRPSRMNPRQGSLYYQIIQAGATRQLGTGYRLFCHEWNSHTQEVVIGADNNNRQSYLQEKKKEVEANLKRLKRVIALFDYKAKSYTVDDVIDRYEIAQNEKDTLFVFMNDAIVQLKKQGRIRTAEAYSSTLNSFGRYRGFEDISLNEIDSYVIGDYERYLKNQQLCPNSTSFYLRTLRSVYNQAVEQELTIQRTPFKHVYMGIDKTVKRAIPLDAIKQIKELDLPQDSTLNLSRNLFLFSFYTRGMSFVDMAFLRKTDLSNGVLSYRRSKTGQRLLIRWEQCMQSIIDYYDTSSSPYLLPIITQPNRDEHKQYINLSHLVNRRLKSIGNRLLLSKPLTMYVARHSWASIAQSENIPISIISQSLGHDSEATTKIYLAALDTTIIDNANQIILKLL